MLDVNFKFDITPKNLAAQVADQNSTNVFDAGAAVNLFPGFPMNPPQLRVHYKSTAGTGARSWRARLVGADDAALTTNPVIIADTGVILLADDGTAIDNTHCDVRRVLACQGQAISKRYYGVIYAMGQADQDGEVTATISQCPQTNMPYRKAAVPT